MTDILSGGEDSDTNHGDLFSDGTNLASGSGSNANSGNKLFGMNIKKTLSRPADRVEQVMMRVSHAVFGCASCDSYTAVL